MQENRWKKNKDKPQTLCKYRDFRFVPIITYGHTNASVMALLNVPDLYAQKRGDWATDRTMKMIYQHTMESKRSAVDAAIDSYFYNLMDSKKAGEPPQNM